MWISHAWKKFMAFLSKLVAPGKVDLCYMVRQRNYFVLAVDPGQPIGLFNSVASSIMNTWGNGEKKKKKNN